MPRAVKKEPDVHGLIPKTWKVEAGRRGESSRWRTPDGTIVFLEFLPYSISLSTEALEVYRADALLAARSTGGGLVECDIVADKGVFAVLRLPDHRRETGLVYTGLGLLPARNGHLAVTAIAHEGAATGERERRVYQTLFGSEPFETNRSLWFYEAYENAWDVVGQPRPGRRTQRSKSDDAVYDRDFPRHPLTRVRKTMARLRSAWKSGYKPAGGNSVADTPIRLAEPEHGFFIELPPGYQALDYDDLRRGRIFRRWTFDNRRDIIGICPQPDFPESGRSVSGARRLLKFNETKKIPGKRKYKALIRRTVLEGREGILCEVPGNDGEKDLLTLAMYLPWGDSALEISVGWEADDRSRMELRLRDVLRTLRRIVD